MIYRICLASAAMLTATTATAANLSCYEEPGTRAHTCYEPGKVRANGSVRSATIWMGGPNEVRVTNITVVTDCQKGVSVLRDLQGVNFAGGESSATRTLRNLSQGLCAEKKPTADKRLRMF